MISVTCFSGLNFTIKVNVETGDFCHTLTRFMWSGLMLLTGSDTQAEMPQGFFFQMYLKLDLCYLKMNWEFWHHWKIIRFSSKKK